MDNETKNLENHVQVFGLLVPIEIFDFFKTAGIVLIICTFVYIFIATPNQVEGESMSPTLANNQLIITDRINYWGGNIIKGSNLDYRRGDIVVFQKPGYRDFVKRIIGLPGEKISLKDGKVLINGIELSENYEETSATFGGDFIANNTDGIKIPENYYFVLGDNRSDSLDSRYSDIGLINRDWLKGKVIFRYWPFSSITFFQKPEYNI